MSEMSDLEIVRACAEAICPGLGTPYQEDGRTVLRFGHNHEHIYDPLHDDAQCMALLKHFKIAVQIFDGGWLAWMYDKPTEDAPIRIERRHTVNEAICLCVARLQTAKAK